MNLLPPMTRSFPFLHAAGPLSASKAAETANASSPASEISSDPVPDATTPALCCKQSQCGGLFEAAVTGVQSHFNHLSPTDIAYPPHAWFAAALARQVALAKLNERYAVPKKRLAAE